MKDLDKIATFDIYIQRTKSNKIRKSIGGNYKGTVGRPKGCKLINKVDRTNSNQARFGHRKYTTSKNKEKDTPIKHGYHTEDYNRICVYAHYYENEINPFYIGQGSIQRAFYFKGPRRNKYYNEKVKDINLIKVKILAIDITEKESLELEKKYITKYKFEKDGGSLINITEYGSGGSRGKYADNKISIPVVQYDKYYNFIKQWASATEAAETLGFDASAISKCCKHRPKYKTHRGYIWEYISD